MLILEKLKKIIIEILSMIGALFFLICLIPWSFTKSYSKWYEEQNNAEENYNSLTALYSMLEDCKSEEERKQLKGKINLIDSYFYLVLHSGRTPNAKYPKEIKKVRSFLKRNDIDIYSEDFNLEYLAKCVREQDI